MVKPRARDADTYLLLVSEAFVPGTSVVPPLAMASGAISGATDIDTTKIRLFQAM